MPSAENARPRKSVSRILEQDPFKPVFHVKQSRIGTVVVAAWDGFLAGDSSTWNKVTIDKGSIVPREQKKGIRGTGPVPRGTF
jgi:hypothetical protein